jgi:hypothetical protein
MKTFIQWLADNDNAGTLPQSTGHPRSTKVVKDRDRLSRMELMLRDLLFVKTLNKEQ